MLHVTLSSQTVLRRLPEVIFSLFFVLASMSLGAQNCPPEFQNIPPTDLTVQCDEVPPIPQNITATSCCEPVSITFEEIRDVGQICGDDYILYRTWTATDNCGNTSTLQQVVQVIDTEPPVFIDPPGDITGNCNPIPPIPPITVTDNCDQNPFVILVETQLPGPCFGSYNLTRLWVARDNCDNATPHVQVVTITDVDAPEFTLVPPDLTLDCTDGVPEPVPGVDIIAVDNCNPNVLITMEETRIDGNCPIYYTLERTFTADDGCGNTNTATQTVVVTDNQPPVISGVPPNVTVECNTPMPASPSASDNCGGPVELTVEDVIISGGGCGEDVVLERVWTATDDCGNQSTASQLVTVKIMGEIGFENVPGPITVECDAIPAPAAVTAHDACGLPLAVTSDDNIYGQTCENSYTIERVWTAADPCGNVATTSQIITVEDTQAPTFDSMPSDMTVSCGDVPDPMMVTASDNCDSNPEVSFTEDVTGQVCDPQLIVRVWRAEDDCGNITEITQTISVQDDEPPVIVNPPADQTISCTQMPPDIPMLTVTDDCGQGNIDVQLQEFQTGQLCDDLMISRVWTVTDQCGNKVMHAQMILVLDDMPPVIDAPADITVDCADVPDLEDPVITDDCDQDLDIDYMEMSTPGNCPVAYTIMRMWTATDDCGNQTTATQNVQVLDTQAPELGFVHPLLVDLENGDTLRIECDDMVIFEVDDVTVSDNCDPNPTLEMEDILIYEGPCVILLKCIWTATDACGNVSTLCFYYLIGDDLPPVLANVPDDLTLECDEDVPGPANVTATDNCTPDVDVVFSEAFLPGNCPDSYMLLRTWEAVDSCGNVASATQKITVEDSTPPTWMPMHPLLIGVSSGDTLFFDCDDVVILEEDDLLAKDNCDDDVEVTFEEIIDQGDCATDGYYLFMECTWTAEDDCGNQTTFVIYALVSDEEAPVLEDVPADITITCETPIPGVPDVTATDNCTDPVDVIYTSAILPGNCPQAYTITRTWSASDECGNETVETQTITVVDDEAPTFTLIPQDETIECDEPLPNSPAQAEDNCDPVVEITVDEKVAQGPCTGEYLVLREWTATDDCGNATTVLQTITVVDTQAPDLVGVPDDLTVQCDDIPDPASVTANDACDPAPTVSFNEQTVSGNCPDNYKIVRTWTATDDCGNTTSSQQVITVVDTEAPVLGPLPASTTIECDQPVVAPAPVDATDNCDADPTVTLNVEVVDGACPEESVIIRTWTAVDNCGNTATGSQTITIVDTTPPTITNVPDEVTLECDEVIPADEPDVADNCDDNPTLSLEEQTIPGQCPQEYLLIRTWTAEDNCGNSSTAQQVIKVFDTTAPELVAVHPLLIGLKNLDTLTFPCDDVVIFDEEDMVGMDNCDQDVDITFSEIETQGDCPQDGFIFEFVCTWTATDDCGNSSAFTIVVRIVDEEAPVFSNVPADLTLECDEDIPSDQPTADDNCDGEIDITANEQIKIGACKYSYTITRTWTATDDCGNTATASQEITIVDTTAPELIGVPDDVTIECDEDLPDPAQVTAVDNCDPNPEVTFKEAIQDGDCPQEYVLLRIWQAEDACGNSSTATQRITVIDSTPPLLIGVPNDMTVECDEVPDAANVKAVDACDPDVQVSLEEDILPGNCPQSYTIIRTWRAEDDCGNVSTGSQTVTVVDTEAPVFTQLPGDLTIACDQPLPPLDFEAVDNCSQDLEVEITLEGGVACDGEADRRIITVTDECGNSATAIQEILLIDSIAPTFKPYDEKVEVNCDEVGTFPLPEAMDNCDDNVEVTVEENTLPGGCPQEYSLLRTFTATDNCGNTATGFQLIVVVDEEAPTLIPVDPILIGVADGDELVFDCDDAPALDADAVLAQDNCDPDVTVTFEEIITNGDCATDGYYLLLECIWSATDACGNTATFTVFMKITDTEAPTFSDIPQDITLDCTDDLPTDEPTVSDNCSSSIDLQSTDEKEDLDCGYRITRTWTATDECGNSATTSQSIRVTDMTAPVFTSTVSDVTVDLDQGDIIPDPPVVEATDNCGDVVITLDTEEAPGADCGSILTRTWTATDECGNTSVLVQVITALQKCPCVEPVIDDTLVEQPDCGEANGSITVIPVGDPSDFAYTWLPNKGTPNIDGNSRTDLPRGTYTILVEDPTALNCFTKISIDLKPDGSCIDTVYVNIPADDPYTVCIEDVLDFDGNILEATVCGEDLDEVDATVTEGSPCVLLDPADGFTGTSELCVIHCNDDVPPVCDTTIIIVSITTFVPCDTIFPAGLTNLELDDCGDMAELCLNIDPSTVGDYEILLDGNLYSAPGANGCGPNSYGILLPVGTHTVEVLHVPTQCVEARTLAVTCSDSDQLLAVDDQATTKKNQAVEIAILSNDIIPMGYGIEAFDILTDPVHGELVVQPDMSILYIPSTDYCGEDQFTYEICISEEVCDDAVVTIDVTCSRLVIHTGFSPNNDGINDTFTIDGIEDYPNNELTVFNRWGNQIYHQKGYKNSWDGSWEQQILPDGTYFYIFKDGEGETYSGYVQIHR